MARVAPGIADIVGVVALPAVNRRELCVLMRSFPEWAAKSVDWAGLVRGYQWNGDWRVGISARRRFASLLHSAADHDRLLAVMDEIRSWGGLRPFGRDLSAEVARSLSILDALATSDAAPPRDLCGTRIATVSKVYAMYDLRRWVIYDSRVAWALASLLHDWSRDTAGPPIGFPQPQGRNGQPFPGVPALASARQGALAFVYASWLCQSIATRIDAVCPDPAGWSATHVEMALFTIGDPKTRVPVTMPPPGRVDDIRESIEARIRVLNDEIAVLEAARAALNTGSATTSSKT
jgi:hypothetical protein